MTVDELETAIRNDPAVLSVIRLPGECDYFNITGRNGIVSEFAICNDGILLTDMHHPSVEALIRYAATGEPTPE